MPTMQSQAVKVHYAKPLPVAILVVGLAVLGLNLLLGEWMSVAVSVLLIAIGIGLLTSPALVVTPERVELKNPFGMTVRTYPIAGFGDLALDDSALRRVSDQRRIRNLRFGGVRVEDRVELERAIDAARRR